MPSSKDLLTFCQHPSLGNPTICEVCCCAESLKRHQALCSLRFQPGLAASQLSLSILRQWAKTFLAFCVYSHKLNSEANHHSFLQSVLKPRIFFTCLSFPVAKQLLNSSSSHNILLTVYHYAFVNVLIKAFLSITCSILNGFLPIK